jgi:hypothetical protein
MGTGCSPSPVPSGSRDVKALFFLNASGGMPMAFVQALKAMDYEPIPLSGDASTKVVDVAIQRTLQALAHRPGDVLLVSHDGDFLADIEGPPRHRPARGRGGLHRVSQCRVHCVGVQGSPDPSTWSMPSGLSTPGCRACGSSPSKNSIRLRTCKLLANPHPLTGGDACPGPGCAAYRTDARTPNVASTNDLKNGMVLNIDGQLWTVIEFQHVKPGKGPAFVRTKLKNVTSGKTLDKTFNAGVKGRHRERRQADDAVPVQRRQRLHLHGR